VRPTHRERTLPPSQGAAEDRENLVAELVRRLQFATGRWKGFRRADYTRVASPSSFGR
jgi:hypothetical protein